MHNIITTVGSSAKHIRLGASLLGILEHKEVNKLILLTMDVCASQLYYNYNQLCVYFDSMQAPPVAGLRQGRLGRQHTV